MSNKKLDIIKKNEAISIKKENGTKVDYFLFDKFEVHKNIIPSGCVQGWHAHQIIEEILFINKGTLHIEWIEDGKKECEANSGEIIRMNQSIHRLSNKGTLGVECTIFRFVSPSKCQSNRIKNDKRSYSDEEIEQLLLDGQES